MNIQKAAELMLGRVDSSKYWISRDQQGRTVGHAMWMLTGIIEGYIQHEKAHRWLGYAQGILVNEGCETLGSVKHANKLASDHDGQGS